MSLYQAALEQAHPNTLLASRHFSPSGNPLLLGAGKASYEMMEAFVKLHRLRNAKGCVVIPGFPRDHFTPRPGIQILRGDHPVPTWKSVNATKKLLKWVNKNADRKSVVFFLSGGASSLLELPRRGLSLQNLSHVTRLLLRAGATIQEMNVIRKHLSDVKGGGLALRIGNRNCITLILSDVEGDDLETIGSAPTYPDHSTFSDAMFLLKQFHLEKKVSLRVFRYLQDGVKGNHPETVKPKHPIFRNHSWKIIGNFRSAMEGALRKAKSLELPVVVEASFQKGEAGELGRTLAGKGKKLRGPALFLAGGEPTVHAKGKGRGGRCQETALSFLIEARGPKPMFLLSGGTDGRDGPTDAAGALASHESYKKATALGLDPEKFLAHNDSCSFFSRMGDLIPMRRTGTNVNDLFLLWVP